MGIAVSDEIQLLSNLDVSNANPVTDTTADGGRIVSWVDGDGDLVTQRYNSSGELTGDQVQVGGGESAQYLYPIYALDDGGWVQSFMTAGSLSGYELHSVRYSSTGQLLGTHVADANDYPRVIRLSGDNYAVFNFAYVSDYSYSLSATFFDANGQVSGTKTLGLVDSPNAGAVTSFDNGAWSIWLNDEGEHGTYCLYDSNGTLLNSVAGIANGKVTFDADGGYRLLRDVNDEQAHTLTKIVERFDADGQLLETITHPAITYSIAYMSSQTTTLENGNSVVIWTDHGWDYHGHLFMRVVDPQGNLVAADTELTKINPYDGFGRVVELSTGSWVVLWQDTLQVFNPNGSRHGGTLPTIGTSDIVANDSGGWTTTYFTSFDSGQSYGLYTRTFQPNDINNAPVALTGNYVGQEDTAIAFNASDFQSLEPDGDAVTRVVIETLPGTGRLLFDGNEVTAGQIIDLAVIDKLTWTPAPNANGTYIDNLKFDVIDEHGVRSGQAGTVKLSASATNDLPTGDDLTITIHEDERIHLARDLFPVFDIDGEQLTGLEITPVVNGGVFTQGGSEVLGHTVINWNGIDSMYFQPAANGFGDNYAVFNVKYITGNSGTAEQHTLTINVLSVNDAPDSKSEKQIFNRGDRVYLNDSFQISDVEGHDLQSIILTKLPEVGKLRLGNILLEVGDEIPADDIDEVNYSAGAKAPSMRNASFWFQIRDAGGTENGGDDLAYNPYRVTFDVTKTNVIAGTMSDDVMTGSRRADVIEGGAGSDLIFGGRGEDKLYGGTGSDIFVLRPRGEVDSIYDFSLAEDRIDLTKTHIDDFEELQDYLGENHETLAFIGFDSKTIPHEADGFLLFGIRVGDLTESNFIFAP